MLAASFDKHRLVRALFDAVEDEPKMDNAAREGVAKKLVAVTRSTLKEAATTKTAMQVKQDTPGYQEPEDPFDLFEEQLAFLKERLGSFFERRFSLGDWEGQSPRLRERGADGAMALLMALLSEVKMRQVKVSTKGGNVLWLACDETTLVAQVKAEVVHELKLKSVVGLTKAAGGGAASKSWSRSLSKSWKQSMTHADESKPTKPLELHLLPDWGEQDFKEHSKPLESRSDAELLAGGYRNADRLFLRSTPGQDKESWQDKEETANSRREKMAKRADGNFELQLIYKHEMRAVPLGSILEFEVWQEADFTQPEDVKAKEFRRLWKLGTRVTECDHFVSHSWKDEKIFPKMKVKMMRGFLCLQQLLARLLVSFTLIGKPMPCNPRSKGCNPRRQRLQPIYPCMVPPHVSRLPPHAPPGLFFIPLGFAVEAIADEAAAVQQIARGGDDKGEGGFTEGAFRWYYPFAATMACLLVLVSWILLSDWGCVKSKWAPWALYGTTLWLDKCCVLQDNKETIAGGVLGFSRFLSKCDKMIAFVSPSYFSRLWCVYELATFCREKKLEKEEKRDTRDIHERLLLLSLDWPDPLSPFKSAKLTHKERAWFENFSALRVQCTKPADRATVFGEIRRTWGLPKDPKATDEERLRDPKAHEYFDKYASGRRTAFTVYPP